MTALIFVSKESVNWGQTGDIITAIFTATLIDITLGDFHLNLECRDKINDEFRG